jgi:hypothetical protein
MTLAHASRHHLVQAIVLAPVSIMSEHRRRSDCCFKRAGYPLAVSALLAVIMAGCGGTGAGTRPVGTTTTAPATTTPTAAASSTLPAEPPSTVPATSAPSTTNAPVQTFAASVAGLAAADLPHTWRPGCPVSPAELRMIRLSYWGFDNRPHSGAIVVNAGVVGGVIAVFRDLYEHRFPIMEMVPQDAYGGNDNAAAAADDTSGFNCRYAVAPGPPQWSAHAYGQAIDVNDVQNPYLEGATIIPPAGAAYLDRSNVRPGMAAAGGELVDAFARIGWSWGGRWTASPDYQHFSSTGG